MAKKTVKKAKAAKKTPAKPAKTKQATKAAKKTPAKPVVAKTKKPAAKVKPAQARQPAKKPAVKARQSAKPAKMPPRKAPRPEPKKAKPLEAGYSDAARNEIHELTDALDDARADARAARDEVARLAAETDALREQLDVAVDRAAESQQRAEKAAETWRGQLEAAAHGGDHGAQLQMAQSEIRQLKAELDEVKSVDTRRLVANRELEAELEEMDGELVKVRQELEKKSIEIEELQEEFRERLERALGDQRQELEHEADRRVAEAVARRLDEESPEEALALGSDESDILDEMEIEATPEGEGEIETVPPRREPTGGGSNPSA